MYYQNLEACEMLSTGICPHDCAYCYIPKSPEMVGMHRRICEYIESGEFIVNIKEVYGEALRHLGFWGTEPILTLPLIQEKLPDIFEAFPKIETMDFSTSMLGNPVIIFEFINALKGKELLLKFQTSLDGPAFITDVNREVGAAKLIPENLEKLIKMINKIELGKLKLQMRWKPTLSVNNMIEMNQGGNIDRYIGYFEDINKMFRDTNEQENFTLEGFYGPSLVVPGKYTSDDGKILASFLKNYHKKSRDGTYVGRVERLRNFHKELYKRRMFTCSGGDSNLGIGREVHMCHRTFYMNDDDYIDSILKTDIDNWDISLFEIKTIEMIKKYYIVGTADKGELHRFFYVMRGHHDFWRLITSNICGMMKELALAGQADPIYLEDDGLLELFSLFISVGMDCPMENLLNTGSINLVPLSVLRLWGNGAFQEIMRRVGENESRATERRAC